MINFIPWKLTSIFQNVTRKEKGRNQKNIYNEITDKIMISGTSKNQKDQLNIMIV